MRVLIITQSYDLNDSNLGAFIDWWDKLAENVEKVFILALIKKSEPTRKNIEVISMGKESGIRFLGKLFGFYSGLFQVIGKTDAILVHMIPKYVILAAPAALIFRKPIYLWYTGVSANRDLKIAVKLCRKVFTAHEAAMRINTHRRIVTGHGIDIGKFEIQNTKYKIHDKINILSVGRITPSKGHDLIIQATSDLVKSGYNIKLKIIGGVIQNYHKNYSELLKKLSKDLKMGDGVEFSGPVSYEKMPEYLKDSEILINAVPFGGLDKVVLEAMSAGVVPLTSNNAFLSVFPQDVEREFIFKFGDAEDLKSKLKNIIDKKFYQNELLRARLRDIVTKNHNLDNLISRIIVEMKND